MGNVGIQGTGLTLKKLRSKGQGGKGKREKKQALPVRQSVPRRMFITKGTKIILDQNFGNIRRKGRAKEGLKGGTALWKRGRTGIERWEQQ